MLTSINLMVDYLLMQADDRLVLSHRLSEENGHAPSLEEDIAISNIALDLLGQANEFYEYAAELLNDGSTADSLAFLRNDTKFKNAIICEIENIDFANIMARQYFFDTYEYYFYTLLKDSTDERLKAIAEKSLKESTYHLRHSKKWINILADGTEESRSKLIDAIDRVWSYTGELFESNDVINKLKEEKIAVDLSRVKEKWDEEINKTFIDLNLTIPEKTWMHSGGRLGRHSEHLGRILTDMQYLQRAYPNSEW